MTNLSLTSNYSNACLVITYIMPFEMYENQPFKILLLRNFEKFLQGLFLNKLLFTEL